MKRMVLLLTLLLLAGLPVWAQDAPDAINVALNDLSGRLGADIRLSDLDNWTYEHQLFHDMNLDCPQAAPLNYNGTDIDGYQFSLTYHGVTFDYRVSSDQFLHSLCNPEAISQLDTPVCPPPEDSAYLPARLEIGAQGRVTESGLPNNIRSQPGTSGTFLGEIPPGGVFTVRDGPQCSQLDKLVWWQVEYKGVIGWTASGMAGTYWLEPLDSSSPILPALAPITAANAAQVASLPLDRSTLTAAALSPDGSKYATADTNGISVLFPVDPSGVRLTLDRNAIPSAEEVSALAFDARGERLAAAYADGTLALISTAPGDAITAIWTAQNVEGGLNVVSFSPDGTLIATGSSNGNVQLWDSRSGASLAVLRGHVAPVLRLEFSANGATILSQDESGVVILWQVGASGATDFG